VTTDPIPDLCIPDAWHDRYELERGRRQSAEHALRLINALPALVNIRVDDGSSPGDESWVSRENEAVLIARGYLTSIGETS
jgi:hypothetical protein